MRRLGALATALVVAVTGCTDRPEARDVLGLWAAPAGVDAGDGEVGPLTLTVAFVPGDPGGCWSADGEAGLRPVRWPADTRIGGGPTLEVPDELDGESPTVLDVGDVVGVRGRVVPGDGALVGDLVPPSGCDAAAGWYDVVEVLAVEAA